MKTKQPAPLLGPADPLPAKARERLRQSRQDELDANLILQQSARVAGRKWACEQAAWHELQNLHRRRELAFLYRDGDAEASFVEHVLGGAGAGAGDTAEFWQSALPFVLKGGIDRAEIVKKFCLGALEIFDQAVNELVAEAGAA